MTSGLWTLAPFQRLRHIRQLALSNFVYPGATHTLASIIRIGVMELAGRVFDVVTREENLRSSRPVCALPNRGRIGKKRGLARMLALCCVMP